LEPQVDPPEPLSLVHDEGRTRIRANTGAGLERRSSGIVEQQRRISTSHAASSHVRKGYFVARHVDLNGHTIALAGLFRGNEVGLSGTYQHAPGSLEPVARVDGERL